MLRHPATRWLFVLENSVLSSVYRRWLADTRFPNNIFAIWNRSCWLHTAAPSPDWNCQWGPSGGTRPYNLYPRHVLPHPGDGATRPGERRDVERVPSLWQQLQKPTSHWNNRPRMPNSFTVPLNIFHCSAPSVFLSVCHNSLLLPETNIHSFNRPWYRSVLPFTLRDEVRLFCLNVTVYCGQTP